MELDSKCQWAGFYEESILSDKHDMGILSALQISNNDKSFDLLLAEVCFKSCHFTLWH